MIADKRHVENEGEPIASGDEQDGQNHVDEVFGKNELKRRPTSARDAVAVGADAALSYRIQRIAQIDGISKVRLEFVEADDLRQRGSLAPANRARARAIFLTFQTIKNISAMSRTATTIQIPASNHMFGHRSLISKRTRHTRLVTLVLCVGGAY